jgi:hypothetical protein
MHFALLHFERFRTWHSNLIARTVINEKSGKLLSAIAHIVSGGMHATSTALVKLRWLPNPTG